MMKLKVLLSFKTLYFIHPSMTPRFNIIEKIIAVTLIILGLLSLYMVTEGINTLMKGWVRYDGLDVNKITWLKAI